MVITTYRGARVKLQLEIRQPFCWNTVFMFLSECLFTHLWICKKNDIHSRNKQCYTTKIMLSSCVCLVFFSSLNNFESLMHYFMVFSSFKSGQILYSHFQKHEKGLVVVVDRKQCMLMGIVFSYEKISISKQIQSNLLSN